MLRSWIVRAIGVVFSVWISSSGLPSIAQASVPDIGVLTDGGTDMQQKPAVPSNSNQPTGTPPVSKPVEENKDTSCGCEITAPPAQAGTVPVLALLRTSNDQGIRWQLPANQSPASLQMTKICIWKASGKSDMEPAHCLCAAGQQSVSGSGTAPDPSNAPCQTGSLRTLWRSDGKSTHLILPLDKDGALGGLNTPFWSALFPEKWTVAVEYRLGTDASKQVVSSTAEIEVTRRDSAALVAATLVVGLLIFGGLLARRSARTGAGPGAKTKTDGLIDSCLSLITTPLGTYSLSMLQVHVWTSITLFGYIFLWLLTSGTPTIPTQILGLLGVGTGAAMLSRLANGEKQSLPLRYLTLVPRAERPAWSDLINLDGRPSLFKFQMLGFTIATALVVLRELYLGGRFVEISDSLVLLMGLSSASYVGSESLQSKPWSLVKKQVEQIEQLANGLRVSVATREALQQLLTEAKAIATAPSDASKDKAELYRALLTLEEMLTALYSDRPSEDSPAKPPLAG
jgi:hypothetical protein